MRRESNRVPALWWRDVPRGDFEEKTRGGGKTREAPAANKRKEEISIKRGQKGRNPGGALGSQSGCSRKGKEKKKRRVLCNSQPEGKKASSVEGGVGKRPQVTPKGKLALPGSEEEEKQSDKRWATDEPK